EQAHSAMMCDRRRFGSVGCCDMSILVAVGYDLDRAVQIFKPLRPGEARNRPQNAAFFTAVPSMSLLPLARFSVRHLMNPLQGGTRNSFLSAMEKSYERNS